MDFKVRIFLGSFLAFLILASCGVALKFPTQTDADRYHVPLDSLMEGRNQYVQKCGSCHSLFLPEKFTKAQWSKNVHEMKEKAQIDAGQEKHILQYLHSQSKDGSSN